MLNLSIILTTIRVQTCFAGCDIIFTEIMFDNEKETWQKEIAKSSQRAAPRQITGDDTYHLISANKNLITPIMA